MKIGLAIDILMKRKGMTQKRLAFVTGLSPASISLIIGDHKEPRGSNLKKICGALEVSENILRLIALDESDVPIAKRPMFKLLEKPLKELLCTLI